VVKRCGRSVPTSSYVADVRIILVARPKPWYSVLMQGRTIRTRSIREAFLRTLSECGNVSVSAEAAGIGRNALYDWRRNDDGFASEWDAALAIGADVLEDEAKRRAMDGSDVLLMFLLRGLRPARFGQKTQVEISNNRAEELRKLPDEELHRRLAELRALQDRDGVIALPAAVA
jgi:hypothetical protein